MIKKRMLLFLVASMLIFVLPACSSSQYRDGVYYAEMAEFASSGWKDTMELTIEGGKIVKIDWDAIYKDDSIPIRKKQYSKSGLYGMLKAGAAGEWYDQAIAAETLVLEKGIDALQMKEDGYTDAVTGCTVHVNTFDSLFRECLSRAQK